MGNESWFTRDLRGPTKKSTQQEYTKRILGVLVFLQENLDEELSLEEYARVAHFSPYHFHRIFRGMVFTEQQGLSIDGRHHEIYLSDPRRIAPEKLKTILRLPVKKKGV